MNTPGTEIHSAKSWRDPSRISRIVTGVLLMCALIGGNLILPAQAGLLHNSTAGSKNYWSGKGGWGIAGGVYGQFSCQTCHKADATNIKAIQSSIVVPDTSKGNIPGAAATVSFLNATSFGSMTEAGRTSSVRICEVCHTQTAHHRYNVTTLGSAWNGGGGGANPDAQNTAPHYYGASQQCVTCHRHDNGFMASCTSCHGMPPLTNTLGGPSGYATPATGSGSAGAHQQHNIDMAMQCNTCHNNTIMPSLDNRMHMQFSINNANYPKFLAAAGTAPFGSFSGQALSAPYTGYSTGATKFGSRAAGFTCNAYCHASWAGNGGTYSNPEWSTPSSGQCGTCHFKDAASVPASGAAGSHSKHASSSAYGFKCTACHSNVTNTKQHVQGRSYVYFDTLTAAQINSGAKYKGSVATSAPGVASTALAGVAANYGQCSSLYCHSDGKGLSSPGYPATGPTWGNNGTIGCTSCHGNGAGTFPSGTTDLSTPHTAHVNGTISQNFTCVECHARTVNASLNIIDATKHVNALIDYSGARAGQMSASSYAASLNCSVSYCHTSGKKGLVANIEPTAPQWNTGASLNCKGCHGAATVGPAGVFTSAAGEPNYINSGTVGSDTSNSHQKHVGIAGDPGVANTCVRCHFKTTQNGTSINAAYNEHLDKNIDVNFKSIWNNVSGAYTKSTKSCNVSYCHGSATPQWGGTVACGTACHKADNTIGSITPNAHSIHVTSAFGSYTSKSANRSSAGAYLFTCSACHGKNESRHADGYKTANSTAGVFFDFSSPGRSPSYSNSNASGSSAQDYAGYPFLFSTTDTASCTTTYCHSNGTRTRDARGTGDRFTGIPVTWTTTATATSCNRCHGNNKYTTDYRRGFPLYSSEVFHAVFGTQSAGKANAHIKHTDVRGASTGYDVKCQYCHNNVTQNSSSISNKSLHVTKFINISSPNTGVGDYRSGINVGAADVPIGGLKSGYTFNMNGSTCSNVKCHPIGLNDATQAATTVTWNAKYSCSDCHNADMQNSNTFHHAMRNYSGAGEIANNGRYPTVIPDGNADNTGTNSQSRRCTMCHVDHNIFSPMLNANSTYRASNLRTSIITLPMASSKATFAKTDFSKNINPGSASGGGICVSCHYQEKNKSTIGRNAVDTNDKHTPVISYLNYSGSMHNYSTPSVMKSKDAGGTFNANCSKCHNGRQGELAVFSSMTTALHNTATKRSFASIASSGGPVRVNGLEAGMCYACHKVGGSNSTGTAGTDYYGKRAMTASARDTFFSFSGAGKIYGHEVNKSSYAGKHLPSQTDETLSYISANRHVTCSDCHDPHQAKAGTHTAGNAALAKVLKGASGVVVTWNASNWTAPTYTASTAALPDATAEYQICFKCHSGANSNVTTWGGAGAAAWTDIGLEFSPNNKAAHPVVVSLNNQTGSVAPKALNSAQLVAPWTTVGTQVMTCSDCHATDSTASKGPHGSAVKWMLSGTNKAWPYTANSANGTSTGTFFTIATNTTNSGTANGLFCLNCHVVASGAPGHGSWVNQNGGHSNAPCVGCHIRVPHGGKVSRLIATATAGLPARYYPNGNGGGTRYLNSFGKKTYNSYSDSNCGSSTSGCSSQHSGYVNSGTASESW